LVALHFSPRVVGQLPCRLLWSTSPLGVRLCDRAALPRRHTRLATLALATLAVFCNPPADRQARGLISTSCNGGSRRGRALRRGRGRHL